MRPAFTDYYEALDRLVRKLGLQSQVTFYGHVAQPEAWYRQIDIFISNSYSEGLQVAPMEAIASGCYCLSHAWDGAEELLPDANLFMTGSELKKKIHAYCARTESEKRAMLADLYTLVRDNFDVDRTKGEIRQLVESVGANYRRQS
jgi:glycosyltransferase involved in cell wall biosynthesis